MRISEDAGPNFIVISKHNMNLLKNKGFYRKEEKILLTLKKRKPLWLARSTDLKGVGAEPEKLVRDY